MNWFRTHGTLRTWILIGLAVLLCAGLVTHSGNGLALIVPILVFVRWLTLVAWLGTVRQQTLTLEPATGQIRTRAPPLASN